MFAYFLGIHIGAVTNTVIIYENSYTVRLYNNYLIIGNAVAILCTSMLANSSTRQHLCYLLYIQISASLEYCVRLRAYEYYKISCFVQSLFQARCSVTNVVAEVN